MGKEEKWFAVHTFSGYEDRCANYIMTAAPAQGLDDEILEVKLLKWLKRLTQTSN